MFVVRREFDVEMASTRARGLHRQETTFSAWLDRRVDSMRADNICVSAELRNLAHLPKPIVEEHGGMSAYGNHFRCEDPIVGNPFQTYDSRVACIASTLCQTSNVDRRPIEANLKYVGILRKIIQSHVWLYPRALEDVDYLETRIR